MQVHERAMEVYGSEDEMEKARLKKVERREKQQQKKFDKNVQGICLHICQVYIKCKVTVSSSYFFNQCDFR